MRKGITTTGFEYSYDESKLDDMRFVDLLATIIDEDSEDLKIITSASKIITMILGPAQKAKLYDHIASQNDGRVPVDVVMSELNNIIQPNEEATKN